MKRILTICLLISPLFSEALTNALKLRIDGNTYSDEVVVRFDSAGTSHYNPNLDAWKLFSPNPAVGQLYFQCDTAQDLAIYALPMSALDSVVDLYTLINQAGNYTITSTEIGSFGPGACIMLEDRTTGNYYDLRSGNTFPFTLSANTLSSPARFCIHFKRAAQTAIKPVSCFGLSDASVRVSGNGWNYTLTNSSHQVIRSNQLSASPDSITNLTAGIYYLMASTGSSCTLSDTLTIAQPLQVEASFSLSDSMLVLSNNPSATMTNTSENASTYSWNFGDNSSSTTVNAQHSYSAAGTYTVTLTASSGNCQSSVSTLIHVAGSPMGITSLTEDNKIITQLMGDQLIIRKGTEAQFPVELSVYNGIGKELIHFSGKESNQYQVSLNGLTSGELIIRVQSGNMLVSNKLIFIH